MKVEITNSDENPYRLLVKNREGLVEFKGDHEIFDVKNIDLGIFEIQNGDIVEFGPKIFDEKILLYPIRVRTDKISPNGEDIAKDVWNDINNPLTMDTLQGKTFLLVFQYHNFIKRHLFNNVPEGYDLIDFGYGRGGDITKQMHFNKILGIEPNENNFEESLKRLEKFNTDKFLIKNLKAEDKDLIIESCVKHFGWKKGKLKNLCISFMLSLSFFWKSEKSLKKLIKTIKKIRDKYYKYGGTKIKFIFLTIDGQKTLDLISKMGENFSLGPAHFKFKQPNKIHVHIEDTIVTEQDEYLVNLEDIDIIENLNYNTADEEIFLSENEKIFSSLYIYGSGDIMQKN